MSHVIFIGAAVFLWWLVKDEARHASGHCSVGLDSVSPNSRRSLILALALGLASPGDALAGRFDRVGSRSAGARSTRGLGGTSYAEFEFAPASGAGMGAACACSAVTGVHGEAMTFTRGSVGTCIKGDVSAIYAGQMATCASDKPRVMSGANGAGPLGLLVEAGTTNEMMRSEEFDNASWTKDLTAPTITADQAYAPDGLLTADRIQFPAADSRVYQGTLSATNPVGSVYLKGVSGSGTVYLWYTGSGGTFTNATACAFVQSYWSRCTIKDPGGGTSRTMVLGCHSTLFGMPASCSAADVYAWGAQSEQGAIASSYIKSASSTAARSGDVAYFSGVFPAANIGSLAASTADTSQTLTSTDSYPTLASTSYACPQPTNGLDQVAIDSGGSYMGTMRCLIGAAGGTFVTGSIGRPAYGDWRAWCAMGSVAIGNVGGVDMPASPTLTGSYNAGSCLTIGGSVSLLYSGRVVKKVCRSYDSTRCR